MTTAEELRKYADKALKEGGIMYFSDEYLDALASRAEAEQAETEKLRESAQLILAEYLKLRELIRRLLTEYRYIHRRMRRVYLGHEERMRAIEGEMRELGIEVDDG